MYLYACTYTHTLPCTGQSCNALSRMLVPRSKYQEAVAIAKEFAESCTVGKSDSPAEEDVYMGPLVSGLQYERVTAKGAQRRGDL